MTTGTAAPDIARAVEEISAAVGSVAEAELDAVVGKLFAARRIACCAGAAEA